MITIMAKNVGEMIFRSSPMFKMISSIRPRVFIKAPSRPASRPGIPVARAASAVPATLPTVATTMIRPQKSQSLTVCNAPICVRIPVKAKKAGRKTTVTRSSSFIVNERAMRLSCGMMTPSRNAPKMA